MKLETIYRIAYKNGVTQVKNLISHSDFIEIYKKTEDKIYELEKENKFKETNTTKKLKKDLKEMFGSEWSTDKSPLYDAFLTGKLILPKYQGDSFDCIIKKI